MNLCLVAHSFDTQPLHYIWLAVYKLASYGHKSLFGLLINIMTSLSMHSRSGPYYVHDEVQLIPLGVPLPHSAYAGHIQNTMLLLSLLLTLLIPVMALQGH